MEKGNIVTAKQGAEISIDRNKEYTIESLDTRHITRGDGPEGIHNWMLIKLRGVNELQWAKNFQLKDSK